MDLGHFLNKVDETIHEMNEEELRVWIHNYARKIPEDNRTDFLTHFDKQQQTFDTKKINEAMNWASNWFDEVENKEKIVYYIQDKEIGDWDFYYEPGDEFEGIEDRNDVFPEFIQVLEVIEFLIKAKQVEDANELFERLFAMEMTAPIIWKYDDSEIDEFYATTDDLFVEWNIKADYYSHLWMYVVIQLPSDSRFNHLLEVMKKRNVKNIDVIQTVGNIEIKVTEFIDDWIDFLSKTSGKEAYTRLFEASRSYKSMDFIEQNLTDFTENHPPLFLDVLSSKLSLTYDRFEFNPQELTSKISTLTDQQKSDIQKIVDLADESLPENLELGSEIMEIGYEISDVENNHKGKTYYRKRAFRFRSSIVNYLRLRPYLNPDEQSVYIKKWQQWPNNGLEKLSNVELYNQRSNLRHNSLSTDQETARLFFSEDFNQFFEKCKSVKAPLGWSNNTLGFGVPLFLLFLNENDELSKAMGWMISYINDRLIRSKRDRVYFEREFIRFKRTATLSKKTEQEIIVWLDNVIASRTKALLDAKHTNVYYRAVELIIAYGEVLESRGKMNARTKIVEQYRKKYNRYNRFTREIKERL